MSLEIAPVALPEVLRMRHEVMYPELTLSEMALPDDAEGTHLGLYDNGLLCSVVSLFEREGGKLQFRKFATVTGLQGKGYGTRLLSHVFADARARNLRTIWCNARVSAQAFYQRFGMVPAGDTWEQQGHQFIKMQIDL